MPGGNPAGDPTREIFASPWGVQGTTSVHLAGHLIDAAGEHALMRVPVPHDFTAIAAIELIVNAANTIATRLFDIITAWGSRQGGEAFNVHTEAENARNIGALVANEMKSHDISDLVNVAPLAVGDILVVDVSYNAGPQETNFYIVGLRFLYT